MENDNVAITYSEGVDVENEIAEWRKKNFEAVRAGENVLMIGEISKGGSLRDYFTPEKIRILEELWVKIEVSWE